MIENEVLARERSAVARWSDGDLWEALQAIKAGTHDGTHLAVRSRSAPVLLAPVVEEWLRRVDQAPQGPVRMVHDARILGRRARTR
jgi:hypothetical protein